MNPRSNDGSETKDEFIGFHIEPSQKRRVEQEANQRGLSISELARQRLKRGKDDGDT